MKFFIFLFIIVLCGILAFYIYQKYSVSADTTDSAVQHTYDTDPGNDAYIKGHLTHKQLKILDKILLVEKKHYGTELPPAEVNKICRYDAEVMKAYKRWTRSKNMMRSYHRVVYPDERKMK